MFQARKNPDMVKNVKKMSIKVNLIDNVTFMKMSTFIKKSLQNCNKTPHLILSSDLLAINSGNLYETKSRPSLADSRRLS